MIDPKQTTPKHQPTMNEKTETPATLAAILAEMRHRADNYRQDGWESVAEELEELCERIDAAAAREYAQWHGETNAAKEERNRIACKMRYEFAAKCRACKSTPGNAAAMRGALDKAECVLLVAARFATDNAFTDAEARENLRYVDWDGALTEIDAALAAPARNCDRFATEMEAWEFYFAHTPDNGNIIDGFPPWLFATEAVYGDAAEADKKEGGDHA